jgi:hypothetical protein
MFLCDVIIFSQKDVIHMNVVIIDSGISLDIIPNISNGIAITKKGNEFLAAEEFNDEIGHGTAVAQLFLKNIENKKDLILNVIKLEGSSKYGYNIDTLLYALDYLNKKFSCDLLIICSGIRTYSPDLHSKLKDLYNKGTIIFSAFDNYGSMSYPAAFDCVIGVDIYEFVNTEKHAFISFKDGPINIIANNKPFKVKWLDEKNNIVKGSSFACADIAGIFANYHMMNLENSIRKNCYNFLTYYSSDDNIKIKHQKNTLNNCKIAVAFPFNKEIHALALNQDLLLFEMLDFYDVRQSGRVNIEIQKLLRCQKNTKKIKNIDDLDWEGDFDTFILGHCDKLRNSLSFNIVDEIIKKCTQYKKYLISLDNLENYNLAEGMFYYPYVGFNDIPYYNRGKMYVTDVPVLGVFGTSSKQGKFTLQLMLRRLFKANGFSVAQIGTEPTAALFGMDYVFPMGYNSSVYTSSNDNIAILNNYIHGCELKNPDIIIVGSQSCTCPYNILNINLFTLPQIEFLFGTQPDVVVLCVNVCDDITYVKRTLKTLEGVVDCKVIAFVLFPRKMSVNIEMISAFALDNESQEYKKILEDIFQLPVYSLDFCDIQRLFNYIIDYLS